MIFGMIFSLVFWIIIIYGIIRLFSGNRRKMHRWLQRELSSWEEKNIINQEQGNAILSLYKLKRLEARKKMDMVKVLTLVGAIFLGVGVIFFVASNWQRIPSSLRTIMLLAVTLSTLYLGYLFSYEKEGFSNLGKSLLLLASLFWGGTIALIAQIYNIPTSQNWYIVLLWAFPIIPIAIIFENDYVHILASALFLIWNFLYTANNNIANYYYPIIIFALMLPTAKNLIISRRINIIGLVAASIYCCFNKYEWLALFISVGLLAYYVLQKEERVYLYTASLSFILWTITYFTVRQQQPNSYFLLPLGFILYLTYKEDIRESLVICLLGFMIWMNFTLASLSKIYGYDFNALNFITFQSLLGIIIYIVGIISKKKGYLFLDVYKVFGYLVAFFSVYLLSFRSMLEIDTGKTNQVYFYASLFVIAIIILLIIDELREGYFLNKDTRLELAALVAALLGNSLILTNSQSVSVNTIVANIVLVMFALTNIFLGVEIKKPAVFTTGILIFALFIITRYIDVGWKLKEKSLFFIVGGLVILSLGVFLEKQRRKIIERMNAQ
jgi:uncharacterized membrane protein